MPTISHRSPGFAPEARETRQPRQTHETRQTADTLLFMHEDFEVL
jgi:hypothetical protein